jgi:hypothetical protein
MDLLDPESQLYTRALHKLRDLCGRARCLPVACQLPDNILLESPLPVSQGGFSDVYRGRINESIVALKVLRVHADDRAYLEKVSCT